MLRQGKIAYTKAKVIARLKDKDERKELLETAISENLSLTEIQSRLKDAFPLKKTNERKERVENTIRQVKQAHRCKFLYIVQIFDHTLKRKV